MERLALEQVTLGTSSLRVSRVALGMMSYGADPERAWALDAEAAEPIVRYAVENGFTFFDTADMYSNGASEVVTGRLVRKLLPREEAVVATKVFYPVEPGGRGGLSRAHILEAIDASLGRLQMVALLPYSPLAQGFLAGTQSRQGARHSERARARSTTDGMYSRSCDFDISERVAAIASERGVPPAQVALAWLMSKPGVTAPIIGATRAEHKDDAVAATRLTLTPAEIEQLEALYQPRAVID